MLPQKSRSPALEPRTGFPPAPQFQTLCLVEGGFLLQPATMMWWRLPGRPTGVKPVSQNLPAEPISTPVQRYVSFLLGRISGIRRGKIPSQ